MEYTQFKIEREFCLRKMHISRQPWGYQLQIKFPNRFYLGITYAQKPSKGLFYEIYLLLCFYLIYKGAYLKSEANHFSKFGIYIFP